MNPATLIRRSAAMYANRTAVWFEGREQSYAQLHARACRLANVFRAHGARPGDRVAVLGENAFETIELAAACALGNFVRATLYTYHAAATNRYLLELVDARILVVHASYYEALRPLLDGLPQRMTVIVHGGAATGNALGYDSLLDAADPADVDVPVHDDDVHIIRFSSGTTGKPKGVFHTVARWMQYNNEYRWVTPVLDENSCYVVPSSLAHMGVAFLWGSLATGARIVPMPSFDAARAMELFESQRATHSALAPVMIREMIAVSRARERDLSSLKCLLYAGSPIAAQTLRGAIEVFGHTLHQLYAQSEAMPVTMLLPHQHVLQGDEAQMRRMGSVGRPTPNVLVTIRGEDGAILPPGGIGEIAAQGPSTMSGIWNDPGATAARTLPDGSVLTRDMGYIDEDGFVYLVDRKDDMIVSGGYNVWPTELEQSLCTHAAVADACVFGVPDAKWGETPKAVVVLRPGATVTAAELMEHARAMVGGVKKITSIEFADALPRTATGKVQRNVLRDPWWQGHNSRIAGS